MGAEGAGGRALSIEDLFALRWLSDVRLSPDGQSVACVETRLDDVADGLRSRVLVIHIESGSVVSPSTDDAADRAPRWSTDGSRLAFVGDRGAGARLWVAGPGMDDAWPVPASLDGVSDIAWHPDGHRLAVSYGPLDPNPPTGPLHAVESISYKHDGSDIHGTGRSGIATIDLGGSMTPVVESDAIHRRPTWSPDGRALAWIVERDGIDPTTAVADIWVGGHDGSGARPITNSDGPVVAIAWAPDSSRIAWLGHEKGPCTGLSHGIRIADLEAGRQDRIEVDGQPALGLTVRSDDMRGMLDDAALVWVRTEGRDRMYARWADGGRGPLGHVGIDGRLVPVVSGDRAILSFSVDAAAGRIAFVSSDIDGPGEVSICDLDGASERRITRRNRAWQEQTRLGRAERIEATAGDGQSLEAWLMLPPEDVASGPVPLILSIHGGPHYPVGWRFYFEHRLLAAKGYAVLSGNPRGSTGYGDDFATANHADWGGVDHSDLMTLLDTALDDTRIDAGRIGITGVSYGGYMTLWSIAHEDRFAAAVSENGISDLASAHGTGQDGGALLSTELGGPPWERPTEYLERSPLRHADGVRTPLLLLHAELDQNCPVGQSEEMFTALRRLDRTVSFVRVPGHGHLMDLTGTATFRRARAELLEAWWDEHLR